MNAEIFAEWLRRQGYRVVRTASSYWYEAGSHVYQAFPYQWLVEPVEQELNDLLINHHAIALRYSTPVTNPLGKVSYHVVCDGNCDLEALPRQARQCVRKGLAYASVEPIPLARLADEGWKLRQETLQRQGRASAENQEWWRTLCDSAEDLPGFEAWGAIHEGELVASVPGLYVRELLYTAARTECHSPSRPSCQQRHLLCSRTPGAGAPSYFSSFFGVESLDAPSTVDEFKFRMGFAAKPVRQRVVFHPWLAPLANTDLCCAIVRQLLRRRPDSIALAKGEGMLRFCREGRRSPGDQTWPDSLVERRNELLKSLSSPA